MLSAITQLSPSAASACAGIGRLAGRTAYLCIPPVKCVRAQSSMAVETPTPISELPSSDRLAVADAGSTAATMSTTTVASPASGIPTAARDTVPAAGSGNDGKDVTAVVSERATKLVDKILSSTSYGANIYKRERLSI